jgi:hypothetical protein
MTARILTMMTLRRFRALTQSYGAQLPRWPQEEHAAAEELLRSSAEARALLAQEQSLDEAIAVATAHQNSKLRPQDELAAMARLRSGVAARIATQAVSKQPGGLWSWLFGGEQQLGSLRRRRLGLATTGAVAIVAGLLVGGLYGPAPAPAPVGLLTVLLQPSPLEILSDYN